MNSCLRKAFVLVTCLRVSQLCLDYNYDRPDEYWQGSEVAYHIYYGYGYLSWEWTMDNPIRSPLYQLYLALGYFACQHTYCTPYLRQIAPKIMQMLLSILCDYFLLRTAAHYVKNISFLVSLCLLTQWYYFAMLNRTYINSAETCLAVISFYFWTTRENSKINDYISRLLVVINFCERPSSLFLWAVIWPYELLTKPTGKIRFIFKNALQLIVVCLFSVAVGTFWYGKLIWIDYNFFKYNVFLKFSELYGVNSFFEYFYLVIPYIMTGYLLPFLLSLKQNLPYFSSWWHKSEIQTDKKQLIKAIPRQQAKIDEKPKSEAKAKTDDNLRTRQKVKIDDNGRSDSTAIAEDHATKVEALERSEGKKYCELFLLTVGILLVLSLSTHKERRFLLVLTPFLLLLSIPGFLKLQKYKGILVIIILFNLAMFVTFNIATKTGGTKILRFLREQIDKFPVEEHQKLTVMYLCQPHSLPLMTVLQRNIDYRLLDTSPFRKLQHFDEEKELNQNPQELFREMGRGKDPEFVIIQQKYSVKGPMINERYAFLLEKGYRMLGTQRNIDLFDEPFLGWDGFVLLMK